MSGLEDSVNRYDRQERIEGWQQRRLEESRIAIIGSGPLAQYTSLAAGAMGFGCIELYGRGSIDGVDGNVALEGDGSSYAGSTKDLIAKINPEITVRGLSLDMDREENCRVMSRPDLIIEGTHDVASKVNVLEYGAHEGVPVLSAMAMPGVSAVGCRVPGRSEDNRLIDNLLYTEASGKDQDHSESMIAAAVCVEEARKIRMPIGREKELEDIVVHNMAAESRGGFDVMPRAEPGSLYGKTVVMVGAGALGNFLGLDLALSGVRRLYIIDDDEVESTNLNRQILYYDSVGMGKAEALASKLSHIAPLCECIVMPERVGPGKEDMLMELGADLLVDTVDNNKSRAYLNYVSLRSGIPFLSGGTSYDGGQVILSVPGQTACLNCQADIDRISLEAYTPHQSCIYAPQPSVITSNQLVAGLMGSEARALLSSSDGGHLTKVLRYSSQETMRLGSLPSAGPCGCHEDKGYLDGWMDRMRHLYEVS